LPSRLDLRKGSFRQAWDECIPSLGDVVRGGQEYKENCGKCGLWSDCRWCDVYGYLEHGRHGARVDYLQGFWAHAAGFVMDSKGLLFVGHSDAGKSTMMKMLRSQGEMLCDDRIIVRRWQDGFRIHGTWSHG
jgi:hypothetical protein